MAICVTTSTFFKSCYYSHHVLTTRTTTAISSCCSIDKAAISSSSPFHPIKLCTRKLCAISGGEAGDVASGRRGDEYKYSDDNQLSLLDSAQVFDLNGNPFFLSDLWKHRKAVVAFARHFGCVLCRKRADYLASKKDQMDASGVALILIGPGTVDQAKAFAQQTKFQGEIYADPNHSSYEALSFVSGVLTTFTPKAGLKIIQSYMEGYRQDWGLSSYKDTVTKGGWQQGGIIVAGPGKNNISYIHKDKEAGDDPDIEDIMEACCRDR